MFYFNKQIEEYSTAPKKRTNHVAQVMSMNTFFKIDKENKLDKSSHVWWLKNCAAGIQKLKLITLPVIYYASDWKVGNYQALELELENLCR